MTKNYIYQYLSLVRYKSLFNFLNKINIKNLNLILDFEDSAKDLFNEKNTSILKKNCRDGLLYFSKNNFNKFNTFVRINHAESDYFNLDVKIIRKVRFHFKKDFFANWSCRCIVQKYPFFL